MTVFRSTDVDDTQKYIDNQCRHCHSTDKTYVIRFTQYPDCIVLCEECINTLKKKGYEEVEREVV